MNLTHTFSVSTQFCMCCFTSWGLVNWWHSWKKRIKEHRKKQEQEMAEPHKIVQLYFIGVCHWHSKFLHFVTLFCLTTLFCPCLPVHWILIPLPAPLWICLLDWLISRFWPCLKRRVKWTFAIHCLSLSCFWVQIYLYL